MAKIESSFKNMVLSLTLISTAFALCLGVVYELTKEPIAQTQLNKKLNAISQVVPEFNNNPDTDMFMLSTPEGDSLEIYPALNGENLVGYAVNSYTMNGFSGKFSIMVGFNPDGSIYDIMVLSHAETPGLGSKMAEPEFKDQFKGKNPATFSLNVKKEGGDIDAITAATISSKAFGDAINRAYKTLFPNGPDSFSGATASPVSENIQTE